MKKQLITIAVLSSLMGCTTSTYVNLPEDSVLKIQRGQMLPMKEGKIKRTPLSWSSAGGIPYKIEKNNEVIGEGKMRAKFRPAAIFWPPAALVYWPIGFRLECNDLTGETPTECSEATLNELKAAENKK